MLKGLEGMQQLKDNVTVHGKDQEHDRRLEALLKRLEKNGITLRKEKCEWGKPETCWFSMIYNEQEISINPVRTEAVGG